MGKLSCNCLNIKIHTKGTDFKPCDIAQLDLNHPPPSHEFFSLRVAEVQLNLEGIITELSLLTRTFKLSDNWSVCRCVNCKLWTHANQSDSNTVLVNLAMKTTETEVADLKESSEYSVLYKILVPARNECYVKDMVAVDYSEYSQVQDSLSNLEYSCEKYLKEEKSAMAKRIRDFEERQREEFNIIEGKVRRDKNTILTMILTTQEEISSELNAAPKSSLHNPVPPPRSVVSPVRAMSASTVSASKVTSPGFAGTTGVRCAAKVVSPAVVKPRSALTSMLDDKETASTKTTTADLGDDMGMMFVGNEQPSFYSSDEDELGDTDDSEPDIRGSSSSGGGQVGGSRPEYSSSVPISINNWSAAGQKAPTFGYRDIEFDERDDEDDGAPQNMAESIKALARSVHTDGTECFGELPRSRFKTDYKKSQF